MTENELILELDAIIDSVNDGIYVTDGRGITLRVNRTFEEITDIPASRIVGHHVRDCLQEQIYNKSVSLLVLEEKKPVSIVETLKNGKTVLLTGTPVFDDQGNIFRVVTTLRDMAELNRLRSNLEETRKTSQLYEKELYYLRTRLRSRQEGEELVVVRSKAFRQIVELAGQLGGIDSTILITGESGVGKEEVTRIIHYKGERKEEPFIAVNCGALPETLLESELFGYEKGSFTGAEKQGRPGFFEVAGRGTLFLDEISEISLNLQVKLLRALQEREFVRLGGRKPVRLDARIIAATNQDLAGMVKEGRFREDLYYRLNVVPIHVPPVRERRECILPLISHFLDSFNRKFDKKKIIDKQVLEILESYEWPGNIREIMNLVERMVVLSREDIIMMRDLPENIAAEIPGPRIRTISVRKIIPLKEARRMMDRQLIAAAYRKYGSTRKAAEVLEISQPSVVRKMRELGLSADELKPFIEEDL